MHGRTPRTAIAGRRASRLGAGWLCGGLALVLGAVLFGTMVGPAGTSLWRVPLEFLDRAGFDRLGLDIDSGLSERQWSIVWHVRLPRVLLAGLVGATLSVSGAAYQGVFRNPLVDPYLLGTAAGAGLGATLVYAYRDSFAPVPGNPVAIIAFVFAVGTVALTYLVGGSFGAARSPANLVLAGVAVLSLMTAIQTFILQRNTDVVREVYTWILGRVSLATWTDVRLIVPYVAVCCAVLFLHGRHLDTLSVGDDEAAVLGTDVRRVRLVVVLAATLGTAAAVAVSGLIGFVGLLVPHIVRLLTGPGYRRVLPVSAMFGAAFLILVDIPARMLTSPSEIPIGVVTAFFGAPFFIVLLHTTGRRR